MPTVRPICTRSPAFLLGQRHAGIAEKLGSPGSVAQKGLGGRTRNLLANSRTDFLCESRRQGLRPGQAAPAPRTVLGSGWVGTGRRERGKPGGRGQKLTPVGEKKQRGAHSTDPGWPKTWPERDAVPLRKLLA